MAKFINKLEGFDKNWLMAALSSVGDGIISFDEYQQISFANRKACDILDLDVDLLLGKPIDHVIKIENDYGSPHKLFVECFFSHNGIDFGLPKNSFITTIKNEKKYISAQLSHIKDSSEMNVGMVLVIRDITKIVQTEQNAVRKLDQMTSMFFELPIGMLIIDASLRVINSNHSFTDLFGIKEHPFTDAVLGDAIKCVGGFESGCGKSIECLYCKLREQLKRYIEKGKAFKNYLTEIRHDVDGETKTSWLNICFLPFEFGDGLQYLVSIEDYTERYIYEKKLREAQNTSMMILNNLPVMIFRLTGFMDCDFVNETFKAYFDIPDYTQFLRLRERMPKDQTNLLFGTIHKHFIEKKEFSLEIAAYNGMNQLRYLMLIGSPILDGNNKLLGMLCVLFDVHDEKVSELRYRQSQKKYFSLYQNLESSVIYFNTIKDANGNVYDAEITECNSTTYKIFDILNPKNIKIRFSKLKFLTASEIKQVLGKFDEVIKSGESYHVDEQYLVHLDRWIELSIYRPDQNEVAMLITDIDEKKRTEIALIKEKERSDEANRVKSEFLANMSHEIRTPLNGIIGMIDLTTMETLSTEQSENLVTAKECVTSLIDIINDILDFSKIEAGKLSIQIERFIINELIENTLKLHLSHLKEKNLELKVDLKEVYQNEVMGDFKRIKQVLNNLLSNAIKFTDQGCVWLKVIQEVGIDPSIINTTFQVNDTGIGIEYTNQNMLFHSFTQIDGSYTRKYGGTGLGLVISKQLVEMMAGSIKFQSEPKVGSTFEFTLPLKPSTLETKEAVETDQRPSVYLNKKILLVEDDKVNQIVMEKMLEREGVIVTVADNGYEGLKACDIEEFNLILMDIQMPIMDGIESTRQIRMNSQFNRMTPIIALTAFALKGDEEIFIASGMDGYISKPVDKVNLVNLLNEKLETGKFSPEDLLNEVGKKSDLDLRMEMKAISPVILNKETLFELKYRVRQLNAALINEDYMVLEVNAHQLKVRFEALKAEELKNLAFKIELEIRKERFDHVGVIIQQLQNIIEGFNNVEEALND